MQRRYDADVDADVEQVLRIEWKLPVSLQLDEVNVQDSKLNIMFRKVQQHSVLR